MLGRIYVKCLCFPASLINYFQVTADPFDESEEELRPHISWKERWPLFLACLRGQSGIPCRSSNLLHVLGSVTVR